MFAAIPPYMQPVPLRGGLARLDSGSILFHEICALVIVAFIENVS